MLAANTGRQAVPYLLSSKACAGADGTQELLLPLVALLVGFVAIVTQ